jgi:hypothetical protein
MRRSLLPLIVAGTLFSAPAAIAAPTCQDINGGTIRCGTPGAMPVGWTLPLQQRLERDESSPVELDQLLKVICVLGVYFCLLAMLPEFERWSDEEPS